MKVLLPLLAVAFTSFLLTPTITSAQSCGDFITTYDSWEDGQPVEERQPIEDCDNPFNAITTGYPNDFPVFLDEQLLEVDSDVTISADEWKTFSYPNDRYRLYLFKQEDSGYRLVSSIPERDNVSGYNENQILALEEKFYPDINWSEVWKKNSSVLFGPPRNLPALKLKAEFEQSYAPRSHILTKGNYFLVFEERNSGAVQVSWVDTLKSFLVPTAHAQIQGEIIIEESTVQYVLPFKVNGGEVFGTPEPTGASSVLFLPGIKASRLYTDGIFGTENQLWEPLVNRDVGKLAMTEAGESIESVYTRDIIDRVFGLGSVYGDFSDYLDGLVADDVIKNWLPFAYDWRYDVFEIVSEGTLQGNEVATAERVYVQELVEELATESKSGKVTIIAHSNGGLLAKALMIELKKTNQEELVDQIIFIGSPQLGTPKAIAALLHGYGEELLGGWVLSDDLAREITRNMRGPYALLPSQPYFESVADRLVISFDDSETTSQFRDAYGNAINTELELFKFLVGAEGRGEALDINDALKLNPVHASNAFRDRREQLDTWEASLSTKIVEVVGTGIETESGFYYREFTERECTEPDVFNQTTCEFVEKSKPMPQFNFYGDGTVIGWSAEGYEGDKQTYFYDLFTEDEISHANITESDSVQRLTSNLLTGVESSINFISKDRPEFDQSLFLIGAHSPVEIMVFDSLGNRTGKTGEDILEEIPGSSYREIAGSKYVMVPTDIEYSVVVTGLAEGGYSFTLEEVQSDGNQSTIREILSATSTSSMTAEFSCVEDQCGPVTIDFDGDNSADAKFDWLQGYSVVSTDVLEEASEEVEEDEVRSNTSSGTRIRPPSQVELSNLEGQVAGITTSYSQVDLVKLYEVLLQLRAILDNWPNKI